jgi:hypothetical protein
MFLHFVNVGVRDEMACFVGEYGTGLSRIEKNQIFFDFATFHERTTPFPENSLLRGEEQAITISFMQSTTGGSDLEVVWMRLRIDRFPSGIRFFMGSCAR